MPDPKPIEGGLALLFERLVDDQYDSDEVEPCPLRVHDLAALKESVRRELVRLLNTRCPVPSRLLGAEERTTLDYGIPDFSSLSAHSLNDQRHIAAVVAATITAFEPRLREVYVEAESAAQDSHSILLRLGARLGVDRHAEPVSFTLCVHPKSGEAEAHEDEPE
jgi:type VI secretion system lysozyme-like protein